MDAATISSVVRDVFAAARPLGGGRLADYIPELANAEPGRFAIAVCGTDGVVEEVGDTGALFTMQSMCKPILYAAALAELGREELHRHVGVEPTGEPFNAIIRLEANSHLPHNPMINAGAIAIAGVLAKSRDAGWMLDTFRRFAGRRDIHVDMPVYLSERTSAHRNRAIGYLLRYFGGLDVSVDQALDLYFQACSVLVSARDVAVMSATLANGGVNPLSGERVLEPDAVRDVLTVMTTCGMYDGAGRFVFDTGMAAKSGVSGGVMAAIPKQMGVCVFSPPLDKHGNSVRGIKVLHDLSVGLGLHLFDVERSKALVAGTTTEDMDLVLREALAACGQTTGGQVAGYARELASVDPSLFGIAVCDVHGNEWSVGDDRIRFSLQAVANPFTYGLALASAGHEQVHDKIGVEPSGNPFDAVLFDPERKRPYNPLGNAGAIAVASLLPGDSSAGRLKQLLAYFARLAGTNGLPVDAAMVAAEDRAGDRNRAIAHLLKNFDVIDSVEMSIELYFQQCSVLSNCGELARMGATLANGGVQPHSNDAVVPADVVRQMLSVMYMCGVHEDSGRFAFEVGIPAKSGASGAMLAVVPGRFGIAVYSPPIDTTGTSVRGAAVLRHLARKLRAGVFDG